MKISVIGAGAFGTALAVALAIDGKDLTLFGRSISQIGADRINPKLPDVALPKEISLTADIAEAVNADVILLAVPTQTLSGVLSQNAGLFKGTKLVACCKGIDQKTLRGPVSVIKEHVPSATAAILTGPSFAADIARGLPTALTLACQDNAQGEALQITLSTPALRLYRTTDTIGAELGGALKNVVAIASGIAMGAGLGESARAAVMTRGFSEMQRFAQSQGAEQDTLSGLSGFGDLTLTCTSQKSRNYRYGLALGAGQKGEAGTTIEGAATAKAITRLGQERNIDLPICSAVMKLITNETDVTTALAALMSRPLKEE